MKLVGFGATLWIALSLVHPSGNPRTLANPEGETLAGAQIAPDVKSVIERKCFDCHSEQTHWPAYSRVFPASWLIESDVMGARSHLNFSRWSEYSAEQKMELLSQVGVRAMTGSMPPKQYLLLHPGNKLTPAESTTLYTWSRTERKRLRSR